MRLALHTGEAEVRDGDYYGTAVNRCARLRAVAHGGQVLLSQATYDLVQDALPPGASLHDLGAHRLRDLVRPERVYQLVQPGAPSTFPPLRSLDAYPHNLPPQLTSFIGRQVELAEIKGRLATTRLLTLTGTGGCGKTRLALQVAADLIDAYPEGVWLVELAPLADPLLVLPTLAAVVGVAEQPGQPLLAGLLAGLKSRRLLLVFDNCEHLLDATARLADALIRGCPGVVVLATSREALGIAGEAPWRVPSLAVPNPHQALPLAALADVEAVQLFLARVRVGQPRFTLSEGNAAAVTQVCRRLDGIPLALELAAARVRALPVQELAQRLDDRFRLLTGGSRTALPRQQTLQATIDWSYQLLDPQEQALLRRLSVFAGGWTLPAAETVGAGGPIEDRAVLDLLTRLVDKSLVMLDESGEEWRYQLLETVRQHAGELLAASGEAESVHGRHAQAMLTLMASAHAQPDLSQITWMLGDTMSAPGMDRIERDHDNMRLALRWLLDCNSWDPALRLVSMLGPFWYGRGYLREAKQWLTEALRGSIEVDPELRAAALLGGSSMAMYLVDPPTALAWASEARSIYRSLSQRRAEATALLILGNAYLRATGELQDYEQARALLETALVLCREEKDRHTEGTVLPCLGLVTFYQGDLSASRRHQEQALAIRRELAVSRELRVLRGVAASVNWLGHVAVAEGGLAEARALYTEGLRLHQEFHFTPGYSLSLSCFANLAAAAGQNRRAVRLGAAALAQAEPLGLQGWTTTQAGIGQRIEALRSTLPVAEQAAVWAEGQAMTTEQAIAYALAEEGHG
ncbi:MAG: adenylate/guanylate cyclase domain-containing protein [Chloroflexi bacterium]|nr:adenylate/guanylate cyclase domain-containing protein [Chloroflexota bacterium]